LGHYDTTHGRPSSSPKLLTFPYVHVRVHMVYECAYLRAQVICMAGGLCLALSHALNEHAFRLLSVAGLRSGGCIVIHVCRNQDQEKLKGNGEALLDGSIVMVPHTVEDDVKLERLWNSRKLHVIDPRIQESAVYNRGRLQRRPYMSLVLQTHLTTSRTIR
jgi:hypothetical protein